MTEPVLYIMMRNDLPSMNPGKAMAQAAHAQALLDQRVSQLLDTNKRAAYFYRWFNLYRDWREEGRGFGTTLVLAGNYVSIENALMQVDYYNTGNLVYGRVFDPTYPFTVENAEVASLIPNSVAKLPSQMTFERIEQEYSPPADPESIVLSKEEYEKDINVDGSINMVRKEMTCAFVFGDKNEASKSLWFLDLHP